VHAEDLGALVLAGQVDEEDLVEAALAQKLGRQLIDLVGGGRDEDHVLLFLHPGEK